MSPTHGLALRREGSPRRRVGATAPAPGGGRGLPGPLARASWRHRPAPGPTRGRDPRSAAIAHPPEVPDQVRDGGCSWQDPLPGRGVRNVETRSTTCPETYKPESPRP